MCFLKQAIYLSLIIVLSLLALSCESNIMAPDNVIQNSKSNSVKIDIGGRQVAFYKKGDKYFYYNDVFYYIKDLEKIQSDQKSLNKTTGAGITYNKWPGGIVYYMIDPSFTNPSRVTAAINNIQNNTVIRFSLVTGTPTGNYITFYNSSSSTSYVYGLGMLSGNNVAYIATNADAGTIVHELGHKLGLGHEHQRPDRDLYININTSIIPSDELSQYSVDGDFNFIWPSYVKNLDFNSIMIYGSYQDFNGDGVFDDLVMTKKDGSVWYAQSDGLDSYDSQSINRIYGGLTGWMGSEIQDLYGSGTLNHNSPIRLIAQPMGGSGIYNSYVWYTRSKQGLGRPTDPWSDWFYLGSGQQMYLFLPYQPTNPTEWKFIVTDSNNNTFECNPGTFFFTGYVPCGWFSPCN